MKRKWLAVGIILLFIGISVAPNINTGVVTAIQENDLIEVTTQACGIQGYDDTTVKLTRKQYRDLEQYLVEFRARLNQTSTRDEAVPIFKDAVVELDRYGLLPKGMNVEGAQRFVIGRYQKVGYERLIKQPMLRNQMNLSNTSNVFCLVCSVTDFTISVGPIYRLIDYIFQHVGDSLFVKFINFLYEHGFILISDFLANILATILAMLFYPWIFGPAIISLNPFQVFNTITLGSYRFNPYLYEYQYDASNGWVATFGFNGIRIFHDQPLWGNLPLPVIRTQLLYENVYYPGIFGFTGFQISLKERMFHLGSALWVEISSEHPE